MAKLEARMDVHSADMRRVEASALSRLIQAESDPNRGEMRRMNVERSGLIEAAFRGEDPGEHSEMKDMRALVAGVLDRRHRP